MNINDLSKGDRVIRVGSKLSQFGDKGIVFDFLTLPSQYPKSSVLVRWNNGTSSYTNPQYLKKTGFLEVPLTHAHHVVQGSYYWCGQCKQVVPDSQKFSTCIPLAEIEDG